MRALLVLDVAASADALVRLAERGRFDTVVLDGSVADRPALVRSLRDAGLALAVNLPLLFDEGYLRAHPDAYARTSTGRRAAVDWLHFACPSSASYLRHRWRTARDQLTRLEPDLVLLDFARGFVRWETVPPEAAGRDVAASIEHGCCCECCVPDPAVLGDRVALAEVRVDQVTALVATAARLAREVCPGTPVGIHLVPWLAADYDGARRWAAGQDVVRLAEHVDLVMPMTYSAMIGRPPSAIGALVAQTERLTDLPVVPCLQADSADGTELPDDVVGAMLAEVERVAQHGFCVFHAGALAGRDTLLDRLARSGPSC